MNPPIGIISCGNRKLPGVHFAKDLYCGSFFKLQKNFMELYFKDYWIVSGKHGLLHPNDKIESYNLKLADQDREYREVWNFKVCKQITKRIPTNSILHFYTGEAYYEGLSMYLKKDYKTSFFLRNMRMGYKTQFFKNKIQEKLGVI